MESKYIWIYIIHKNGNKNINYRKLVTSLYNGYPKPVVYCLKNYIYFSVIFKYHCTKDEFFH